MDPNEKNPHTDADNFPTRSVHHDVLVINPNHELYRFNVRKTDAGRVGEYLGVDYLGAGAPGHRKVMHIARKGTTGRARGAAFATLPVKEEPASSFMCCYLVNAENLNYRNVWTQAEWNDAPDADDDASALHEGRVRDVRLLIADHSGRVLHLSIPKERIEEADAGWVLTPVKDGEKPDLVAIPLKQNAETWNLLRNGCVAGSARYQEQDTPLLNLTSLIPAREEQNCRRSKASDAQITGTFDFKWPRRPGRSKREGDVLVAFLPVPTRAYGMPQQELFKRFEKYAREWQLDKLGLDVRFETHLPFDAFDPLDYDILVSLAPLDGSVRDEQGMPATIPMAELGSYARRVDRGAATLFAGMPKGLLRIKDDKTKTPEPMPLEDYPDSDAFKHFVVHEFGHALGLTHMHQNADLNPTAMTQLRTELKAEKDTDAQLDKRIQQLIKERLGVDVPESYAEEAIRGTWPGNLRYSEWPTVEGERSALLRSLLQDSIMVGLAAHAPGKMSEISPDQYLTRPSSTDLAWLQAIYPKSAV